MDLSKVEFEALVAEMLRRLGEDPEREGLRKTPERVVKAMQWMTRGYATDPCEIISKAMFQEKHESMVLVRDIDFYSMCEHHMLPFFGKAHVAYIPDRRVVGLSKIPKIVQVFAKRLQVQEKMTSQIAQTLQEKLSPLGVGVVLEARHLCMEMRGVQCQNSPTVTSAMLGSFQRDSRTREEFLGLLRSRTNP